MTIRSEPTRNPVAPPSGGRESGGLRPPLSRQDLDRSGPWFRLLLGAALIAWSSYTTVLGVQIDFAPWIAGRAVMGVSLGLLVGAGAAGFLSLGQWLTSERTRIIYAVLLFIDARYTRWQIGPWIDSLSAYHLRSIDPMAIQVVAFVVSWAVALLIARYGEVLLFGKRR